MNQSTFSFLLCLAFSWGLSLLANDHADRPNVVLILADDLGWQDVGCYDLDQAAPMETPHIDSLAQKGVLFRQGYSPAPTCAPTRCAIMSGRHPAVLQKTHVVGGNPPTPYNMEAHPIMDPWYSGRLELKEVTIAEALKKMDMCPDMWASGTWRLTTMHFPSPRIRGLILPVPILVKVQR